LKIFKVERQQIISQKNHYFDTPGFELKNLGAALRIREKNNNFEFTLKQPAAVGLLESTQLLSDYEYQKAIEHGAFPKGIVYERLETLNISINRIEYFGSLLTNRAEFPYKNGLLVLDHSFYLQTEDYEVEYEVEDIYVGQLDFQDLLRRHDIPIRKTFNKIARFYQQKYFF
ncbi:CYTH domain-containing protein, partial [Neobacillus niacini]|uniref:CYTH domain-containing protein n=1 Tax=Neobacillus niacini TaxID=86668 RepID=UPI00300239F2